MVFLPGLFGAGANVSLSLADLIWSAILNDGLSVIEMGEINLQSRLVIKQAIFVSKTISSLR